VLHGDRCTAREAHTNFADGSICLLADNVRNQVVTIHRSHVMLTILSLYTQDILSTGGRGSELPFDGVLREYFQFPYEYFTSSLRGLLLKTLAFKQPQKKKIRRIKIG
jgi:hypothetical protein